MLKFSALVPDATVNYIKNPSVRYDTTDWNAAGATLTRTLDFARFGIASLKVVTAGTALRQGTYYRVSALSGISEPITVSAYVRGTGRVRIRLINNPAGMEWASQSIQLEAGYWQRISVSGFSTGSNDLRLYVETDDVVATARTFYVDGAQMERKAYATTYCDGDQPGCRWNGLYHASTSQRAADTREGGRWVQLAGEKREAQDLYMTVATGLGKAPITNNIQTFALEAGAYFQNNRIEVRPIALTFHAKHKVDDSDEPVSLAALHQLRQLLIDIVKPDRTGGDQDIWFEYDDGNTALYFQARYNGGLEGEWDVRNQFVNSFPLRLLAVSPMLVEDSQEVAQLDFQDTLRPQHVAVRRDGRWDYLNGGVNNTVDAMAFGARGEIYAAGSFTQVNTSPFAGYPIVDANRASFGIAYFDGEKWVSINNTGPSPATLLSIAVAPNGYVYITGSFTSIDGVAANRIAYWNGTNWSAMGTGLNGGGNVVRVAPNGDVYVGGAFTTAGGVTCVRIARWDGTAWKRVGQFGGLNDEVRAIDFSSDGSIMYVGGDFTDQNGFAASALLRVAQYNTATGLFSAMGNGFNGAVNALVYFSSGVIYAGGSFTLSGTDTMLRISKWNGSAWVSMQGGVNNTVNDIRAYKGNAAIVDGLFTTAGGNPAQFVAVWNGSVFHNLDLTVFLPNTINDVLFDPKTQDIYAGGVGAGNILVAGITTVNNPGSAEVKPSLYARGPGRLTWIENQTTKKELHLNLTLLDNEEVFIDFAHGEILSVIRGSLFYTLISGSDFRSFSLIPGDNRISCYMTNDTNALLQIRFTPTHWSADATQHGESL